MALSTKNGEKKKKRLHKDKSLPHFPCVVLTRGHAFKIAHASRIAAPFLLFTVFFFFVLFFPAFHFTEGPEVAHVKLIYNVLECILGARPPKLTE